MANLSVEEVKKGIEDLIKEDPEAAKKLAELIVLILGLMEGVNTDISKHVNSFFSSRNN